MSKTRNYGLSRNMATAAGKMMNGLVAGGACSYSTSNNYRQQIQQFSDYLRQDAVKERFGNVNCFEKVTRDVVIAYGRDLADKVSTGEMKPATAAQYLSSVNSVMRAFETRGAAHWESVSGVRDCEIEKRCFVRTDAPISVQQAQQAIDAIRSEYPRQAALADLALNLGLREREAATLNIRDALSQAQNEGIITISNGTKGGQERQLDQQHFSSARWEGIVQSLERAENAMAKSDRCLIPRNETFARFEDRLVPLRESLKQHGGEHVHIHDLRSRFACEHYRELTGTLPTCEWVKERMNDRLNTQDRQIDRDARMIISEELGHHRIGVTSEYLGGLR